MKLLKLVGIGYLILGGVTLLTLCILDCLANERFLLHIIGIFLVIPALTYCTWRLYDDIREYMKTSDFNFRRPLRLIIGKRSHR